MCGFADYCGKNMRLSIKQYKPMKATLKTGFSNGLCGAIVALIALSASPAAAAPALQLVSQFHPSFAPPAGGNGDSGLPIVSADGRYVLFASTANNLTLTNNNNSVLPQRRNVFLRDRASGTTTLVSANLAGTGGGNGDSLPMGISTNGQFALFESAAGDLVANDANNAGDVFVRDVVNGTTTLVSVSTNGAGGNGVSRSSVMTPDGRYVAFVSAASNLVGGDTNGIPDVFVRDLQAGTTTLASVGATSTNSSSPLLGSSESPEITPDGRFVIFYSIATNLVPGLTSAGEVYVWDVIGGTTAWASASARLLFELLLGTTNVISYNVCLSANGQYAAFEVSSNGPVGTATRGMVLRYNLASGLTDVVDMNANVPYLSFDTLHTLAMTPDGRFIAFVGNDNGTSGATTAIYLWDGLSQRDAGKRGLERGCANELALRFTGGDSRRTMGRFYQQRPRLDDERVGQRFLFGHEYTWQVPCVSLQRAGGHHAVAGLEHQRRGGGREPGNGSGLERRWRCRCV